jgi:hypothetical protein
MIFILSAKNSWLRATNGIEKLLRILKLSSSNVLMRRPAAILRPAEFRRVRFGSSATSRGFSVVPDYAILLMRFSKRWVATSAMTFVRRSDGEDMELCFSA